MVTLCNTESIALTGLTVTFNGTVWVQGVQYNYNKATGLFFTVPGQILVLATTYAQNPDTGAYTVTPGTATLTVIDTI